MIEDKRDIEIQSSPERVFGLIEKMPNKFPMYRILETRPFLFVRVLLLDGWRAAVNVVRAHVVQDEWVLNVGDTMGPFTLSELERPSRYWFTLRSLFFDCRTGYSLDERGGATVLHFDLIAEKPTKVERTWWFFFKPFHAVFANKVLRVIKDRVERE